MDYVREMNNILRRYERKGIEDNATAILKERLDILYDDYDMDMPKKTFNRQKKADKDFNVELEEIAKDFVKDKSKKIDMFDMRKKSNRSRFETFKERYGEDLTEQGYIDIIENIEDYRSRIGDLLDLPSEMIAEFYSIARRTGLNGKTATQIIENEIINSTGLGLTIDEVAIRIRQRLRNEE